MALAIFILASGTLLCVAIIIALLFSLLRKEEIKEEDNKIMIMRLYALEKKEREQRRIQRLQNPKSTKVKTICFRQPNLN